MMTKKELEDLGLSKEQVDSIMKINGNDVENAKSSSAAEVKNLKTEVDGLKAQVSDRDKQLETLKTSAGDNEALKQQIADLQAENNKAKESYESEMNQLKVDFAVEKALTGAKAKNTKAVKALLDLADAKLDKDGSVKGLSEQIEKLKADESSKFLFEAEQQAQQQTFVGFQPGASTTVPDSKQAGYEARLAEARKNNNQLDVIKIKQEAYNDGGIVLM